MQTAIQRIAQEAGEIALNYFNNASNLAVESKGHLDLVTEADRAVETFILRKLADNFPEDGVFGEEGSVIDSRSGREWVIDPIDGTFNFVRGGKDWAVSIGLFADRTPTFGVVYAPARHELYSGGVGIQPKLNGKPLPRLRGLDMGHAAVAIGVHPSLPRKREIELVSFVVEDLKVALRNNGSSAIALAEIARDSLDGYIGMGISSWDVLGMLPILESLGVTTTINWATQDLHQKMDFVCAKSELLLLTRQILIKTEQTA